MFKHQALPPVPPGHGRSSTSFPHSCPVPAGTVTPVHVVTKRFPSSDKVQEIAVTVTPVHVVTPSAFQAFLPVTKYRGFFLNTVSECPEQPMECVSWCLCDPPRAPTPATSGISCQFTLCQMENLCP